MAALLSLTPEIQAWVHDVFAWGGLLPPSAIVRPRNYGQMYEFGSSEGKEAAQDLCAEITHRYFDIHQKTDKALETISKYYFNPDIKSNSNDKASCKKINANTAAEYLAVFCKANNVIWNDAVRAKSEIDAFKKTKLGAQLWKYECFVSQLQAGPRVATPRVTSTGGGSAGSATNSNYKSTGPQSGNARGLVGNPHEKINPRGQYNKMFDVEFERKGANVPYLFVNPLEKKGDAGNNVNKVLEGSGNGWSDCTCYFNTLEEADEFKRKYVALHNLTPRKLPNDEIVYDSNKYSGLHVGKGNLQPNGYFMVETECGKCYIRAGKLNESTETVEEEFVAEAKKPISELTEEEIKELRTQKQKEFEDMREFFETFAKYDLHR